MGFLDPVIDFLSSLDTPYKVALALAGFASLLFVANQRGRAKKGGKRRSVGHAKKARPSPSPRGSSVPIEGDGGGAGGKGGVFFGGGDEVCGGGGTSASPRSGSPIPWTCVDNLIYGPSPESVRRRSSMEHARRTARFLNNHARLVAWHLRRRAVEKARHRAEHQNRVRAYQRRTKSGRRTTVRSHNRKSRRR